MVADAQVYKGTELGEVGDPTAEALIQLQVFVGLDAFIAGVAERSPEVSLAVTQLETVFAYFMIDRFHFNAMNVAFILVGMAVLMGGVQGGAIRPLAARFGERTLALAGFALMAVSLFAVPFMPTVGWTLLPLALSSIGRGIGQPPLLSLVSMTAGPSERGSVMGTFQSSASLARVLGPTAAGALYALYQGGPFVLAAVLMFGACLLAIRLPKMRASQGI